MREVHSLVGGSFLASVVDGIFFSYVFPYFFRSPDRLRQKLRHMDFDAFLRVQFEHHSLVSFQIVYFSFVLCDRRFDCFLLFAESPHGCSLGGAMLVRGYMSR